MQALFISALKKRLAPMGCQLTNQLDIGAMLSEPFPYFRFPFFAPRS